MVCADELLRNLSPGKVAVTSPHLPIWYWGVAHLPEQVETDHMTIKNSALMRDIVPHGWPSLTVSLLVSPPAGYSSTTGWCFGTWLL